jgi:enoyl-CoA hydratase/carnithine racemase
MAGAKETVRYQVERRIATLTLCRPERRNAWTGRMHEEYRASLARADEDDGVRAIVVTGEGAAFCVGADARALEGHVAKGGYDAGVRGELAKPGHGVRPEFEAAFAYHFGLRKPVVAAINGAAAGVGLVLACYCDLRFAAAGAKLTTAHGKLNLPAEYGLSWLLPRLIGLTRANELLLTSRIVLAEEALKLGLLNRVLPAEELLPFTYDFVSEWIANVSRASLHETKRQIYTDLHRDAASAVRESEALLERMVREPDFERGVQALLGKRSPDFE